MTDESTGRCDLFELRRAARLGPMPVRLLVALKLLLRWPRRIELTCPICGTMHRVSARWLDGSKSLRCDCGRYRFYPEAERLRRQAEGRQGSG